MNGLDVRNMTRFATAAALPAAMLILVALMVIPVTPIILDISFIGNIMISLAILMVALSASKPLDFSAFPTVLLLATLFRLALNVASTRVVLVHGHEGTSAAGHVIEAFGQVLIGGDYIVGLFVFGVLMIINLVVITKGAGRVSEVSARFTLDALPGKQMAIDADLNAGLLTPDEAKARRQEVATEADFYGSMDGASKFVKGDAVAGLLILFVNIVGGLILGMFSHGLSFSQAGSTYVTLAIGDALVAQIPALLLSIAAAAIVTRVSSPHNLSGQIGSQFASPHVWMAVGGILFILGLVPAMPQMLILPAAALAFTIGWQLRRAAAEVAAQPEPAAPAPDPHHIEWADVSDIGPCQLEIGYALVSLVDERKGAPLMTRITGIRRQLSKELGFVVPPVKVADDLSLPGNVYRISIAGVIVGEDEVFPNEMLALDSGELVTKVTGRPCKDPTFGLDALWIPKSAQNDAIAAGYTVVDPATVVATHLNNSIIASAAELFGIDDAQSLIDNLKTHYPQLAANLSPQGYALPRVAALCKALLIERVPLRDFRKIAEAMVALVGQQLGDGDLIEAVRQRIGALIVQTIVPSRMPLPVVTFTPDIEVLLNQAVRANPGAEWPFEHGMAMKIVEQIGQAVEPLLLQTRSFALVASPICRPALSRLVRATFPDVAVISYLEIPATKATEIVATIGADQPRLTSGEEAYQKDEPHEN
ncbi:flagellar biosynthesis protein FlhA [Sphingopyxis terrae]|uniref:Flagellar biosynthesis protein FlhA n=1 Tax=Sphingopyxis terrae subsp. ummariensis TaxID=429001 RepID=A0A1Y6EUK8_9SPHN|nr:flagellar biosynthesis protein FlhA [Sphingopyxis terrae]PCF92184.1 flagellar biosynthesis protein FlhA [Sphingopyxis terrae subsp. ummariensis]SMQ65889.1 flagellar biosynthesis protein FlhA [Sphingopyxis terrae subsp. ummariensis]